jgi:hypothetical protein
MRATALLLRLFASVALCAGCGGSDPASDDEGSGGSGAAASAQATTGAGFVSGGGTSGDACPAVAKEIYLLGQNRELVAFHPPDRSLTDVGLVACSVVGGPNEGGIPRPFSMSIDRGGVAWVLYDDGTLHALDLETMDCESTPFTPNQLESFERFGMGFASDGPGSESETLYLSSFNPGDGIGWLDFPAWAVRRVGFYDKRKGAAELTGTGKGELWGLFLSVPAAIAQLDKQNADFISLTELPGVTIGSAWAFAFWGGDFYLFTAPVNAANSRVDRWRPGMTTVEPVLEDAGLVIVGAGVSTCAPTEPPQ